MNKALFVSLTLVALALAGCAEEPAHGTFVATTPAADYTTASVVIQSSPATNNYPGGGDDACDADQITENDPAGEAPRCEEAISTVTFQPEGGAVLPLAGSEGYTLWLVRIDDSEFKLGDLEDHGPVDGGGHYAFPATEYPGEDFTNYKEVQIRLGETTVVATQGAKLEPNQYFEIAEHLDALEATITFEGAQIDVALANVPNGTPLVAWLVSEDVDEETGEGLGTYSHSVKFNLAGEQTSYTLTEAEGFVGDYKEFHIHVGGSSINVAKSSVIRTIEQ